MNEAQLGDLLADFENRIAYLEALHTPSFAQEKPDPYADIRKEEESIKPFPQERLVNRINQVEGKVNYTVTKIQEHLDKKKRTSYIYSSIKREDVLPTSEAE